MPRRANPYLLRSILDGNDSITEQRSTLQIVFWKIGNFPFESFSSAEKSRRAPPGFTEINPRWHLWWVAIKSDKFWLYFPPTVNSCLTQPTLLFLRQMSFFVSKIEPEPDLLLFRIIALPPFTLGKDLFLKSVFFIFIHTYFPNFLFRLITLTSNL